MKKIIHLITFSVFSMVVSNLYSQDNGKATICNSSGKFCYEVTRVKVGDGPWRDACCSDLKYNPNYWNCEDDCGDDNVAPPPYGGYENYLTFDNIPSNFALPSGSNVWIFEDQVLSGESYSQGDLEYDIFEGLGVYSFIEESDAEYVAIKISEGTYAVIENSGNPIARRKSPNLFSGKSVQDLNENYSLKLFPSVVSKNGIVNVIGSTEIQSIDLISLSLSKLHEFNFYSYGEYNYEMSLPSYIASGIYLLRVKNRAGGVQLKKIVVQ